MACELHLVALCPCLKDGEGLPLALKFPQGLCRLLPLSDGLDALHIQGGVSPLHPGHIAVVNRLGRANKRLQLLVPFLERVSSSSAHPARVVSRSSFTRP
ncbi:hypothetical protein E2562_037942 [Oryza meyeriana var. granulata]|uniref:Uncharacterized protein n=1 Tax=Oryza meyeriana var. granulata TaxID=110450 RepID=A0A6G1EU17_9ORYZ|nr:hypothetical protein E2562_037942 [Oryza meyeriana var. granulata]